MFSFHALCILTDRLLAWHCLFVMLHKVAKWDIFQQVSKQANRKRSPGNKILQLLTLLLWPWAPKKYAV